MRRGKAFLGAKMAMYAPELVRPQQSQAGVSRRAWAVGGVLVGALVLVACAMLVGDGGVRRAALESPPPLKDDELSPKAQAAARYAQAMAIKAHDNNDRSGLASAMRAATKTHEAAAPVAAKGIKKQSLSSKVGGLTPKEEKANEEKVDMKANIMVPWVHWPGHPNTGPGDKFKSKGRKQQLLQMPMLSSWGVDKAAQVMPLKELIQRQIVDKSLHEGKVSDYELMAADQKSKGGPAAASMAHSSRAMDCAPFC